MKLININNQNIEEIQFEDNIPSQNIEKLLSKINDDTDIIVSSGANEAVLSFLIKTGSYSDSFRKIKTMHILDDREAIIAYPIDSIKSFLPDDIIGIKTKGNYFPSEGALIYCDRVIVKDRRKICSGDPMFNHYLMQFAIKIYEIPTYDTENCFNICKKLFRFQ